jgi:hypothetical protein
MNAVRIREPDDCEERVVIFSYPNPPPPKPQKKTRAQCAQEMQEKIFRDPRRFAIAFVWAGL